MTSAFSSGPTFSLRPFRFAGRPSILRSLQRARPLFALPSRGRNLHAEQSRQAARALSAIGALDGVMLREARRSEAKIVLLGDTVEGLAVLSELLCQGGYTRQRQTMDASCMAEMAREWKPDLVILDLARPRLWQLEMLGGMAQASEDGLFLPLLMLSGDASDGVRLHALRSGARDFLLRPFSPCEVLLRVSNLLDARWGQLELSEQNRWLDARLRERTRELERSQAELKEAQAEMIVRLTLAAEMHDEETGRHTRRVGLSASLLAQSIGLHEREVAMIQAAAPLHDIGKIAIPDALLLKPGRLSPEEWDEMKTHCRIGAQVLASGQTDLVQVAQRIALFHHEKWDGTGYPMGLRGEQIPLEARILAVSDVFDALTHKRPYKHAWSIDEALHEIESQSERHFDPRIVAAFRELPHESLV